MSMREISFPSANGRDTVRAWAYTPLGTPRGVIQTDARLWRAFPSLSAHDFRL